MSKKMLSLFVVCCLFLAVLIYGSFYSPHMQAYFAEQSEDYYDYLYERKLQCEVRAYQAARICRAECSSADCRAACEVAYDERFLGCIEDYRLRMQGVQKIFLRQIAGTLQSLFFLSGDK